MYFKNRKCVNNSFNEHLAVLFLIHSVFGLLYSGIAMYGMGFPKIPISKKRLNYSCYSFTKYLSLCTTLPYGQRN